MDPVSQVRIARNEHVFRETNDRVAHSVRGISSVPTDRWSFVCECGDPSCNAMLQLSTAQYTAVRRESDCFMLVDGHEIPDVEEVVARRSGYVVVRKTGIGRVAAKVLDTLD